MPAVKKTASRATFKDFAWHDAASRLLRAEIVREGLTVRELVARLERLGMEETEASVKNKLSRGTFSFVFVMQVLRALGHPTLDLSLVLPAEMPAGNELEPPLVKTRSTR